MLYFTMVQLFPLVIRKYLVVYDGSVIFFLYVVVYDCSVMVDVQCEMC